MPAERFSRLVSLEPKFSIFAPSPYALRVTLYVVAFDFVAVRVLCANVVFEALAVVVAQNVAKLTLRGCGVVASRHRNASKRDDKHYGYCKYNFFHNVFIIA